MPSDPLPPSRSSWRAVALRTFWRMQTDRAGLAAAGCAFYATLALFPALSMLVALYGLAFDPHSVTAQLQLLEGLLPPDAYSLIGRQVHALVNQPTAALGWSLGVSAAVALWSAATGTKSMISALNLAYGERERRNFLIFQAVGLAMTLASILGAAVTLAILVALPAAVALFALPSATADLVHLGSVLILVLFVAGSLAFLYAAGPSRPTGHRRRVLPGVLLATVLWLLVASAFSVYAARFAQFDATYGPLGAVAGVMLWFWISAYVVLLGAELNSALEKRGQLGGAA